MRTRAVRVSFVVLMLSLLQVPGVLTQATIAPPRFGNYTVGDDYFLATYTQLQDYFAKLDQASDRMKVVTIGTTEEGRPIVMAIITSPQNHARLDRYKEISARLARAEGLTDDQARKLAAEGKAVVWIDGGLHATEVINAQGLFWMAYQMTTGNDPETLRLLDDCILLLSTTNPDGMELVSNWYMRQAEEKRRSTGGLPRLYHKYVGHDNNRDGFMVTQSETQAIARQLYVDWIPQIMYNQHQTGPAGAIVFVPPFRDPFNYNFDPLIPMGIDLVGAAIHNRLVTEGKAGAAMRGEASYSTWYNGGQRTTSYFHNQIGILTEISGNPTPIEIGLVLDRQLPHQDLPLPVAPGVWHQKQSIDYVLSISRAILDVASRHREDFLYRSYRMGMNSIERGTKDHWTFQPRWIEEAKDAAAREAAAAAEASGRAGEVRVGEGRPVPSKYYDMLRTRERRDPRGYVIPSGQADFVTATKFVNTLIRGGVEVHRATADFEVAGSKYPAGSFVVKAAQAFRPHLRDMFEPQDHPDDFYYPGGPPRPPYDLTGYTLAYQMGIAFDRILDAFDGPFEKLPLEPVPLPAGKVVSTGSVAGYLLDRRYVDSFTATNRLLAAKEEVYWLQSPFQANGKTYPAGTIYVPSGKATRAVLDKVAPELGLTFEGTRSRPGGEALRLRPVRIGLWDTYGGSMPSGWIRWMFEKAFPASFEVVYPPALDAGNLNDRFDVLVFPAGAIPAVNAPEQRAAGAPADVPAEFKDRVGRVTAERTIPQLRKFVEAGGTILAIGSSTSLGYHFGLPIADALVEPAPEGERPVPAEKFFVPGSLLSAVVDNTNPLAGGLPERVDVMFSRSPVFRLMPDAAAKGVRAVAWFDNPAPLRSGWAWGQHYLNGTVAVVDAPVGKGRLFLFGPEVTFRGQPHATFKFLFNGIYYGSATPVNLGARTARSE